MRMADRCLCSTGSPMAEYLMGEEENEFVLVVAQGEGVLSYQC